MAWGFVKRVGILRLRFRPLIADENSAQDDNGSVGILKVGIIAAEIFCASRERLGTYDRFLIRRVVAGPAEATRIAAAVSPDADGEDALLEA